MSFADSSGNVLTKAEIIAAATEQDTETVYKIGADVYQRFTQDGSGSFEGATKLQFHEGQLVKESDINALFKTATVPGALSPATGTTAGGTVVTIDGTDLSGVEAVTFGGTAGTALKWISNERIQVTTPAKSAGAVTVVIKDDSGDITKTTAYTYA